MPSEDLVAHKTTLEMDAKLRFHIQGPLAHVSTEQIQEILRQLPWEAEVYPERKWLRGQPTWQAKSAVAPPCNETHVQLGYERCWLRIKSTQRHVSAVEKAPPEDQQDAPMTWQQATKAPRKGGGSQGKGSGGAQSKSQQPPAAQASGGEEAAAKRRRKESGEDTRGWPTLPTMPAAPTPVAKEGNAHLQGQVSRLEDTVKKLEEMMTNFMQHQMTQGRAKPPIGQPPQQDLAGGGG